MSTLTVYTSASDGYLVGATAEMTYLAAHNAASAVGVYSDDWIEMGQDYYPAGWRYNIRRAVLFFDLSVLSEQAVISEAKLRIKGEGTLQSFELDNYDMVIAIVDGSACHEPLILSDYGLLLNETTSLGQASSALDANWTEIYLNDSGIAKLYTRTAIKLALRSTEDIDIISPYPNRHWGSYISYEEAYPAGGVKTPHLLITYEAPPLGHKIWVVDTQLRYGEPAGSYRYIEGENSGDNGVIAKIGKESGGTKLRYCDEFGDIREIEGDDTQIDTTTGKLGYEPDGTKLRYGDASGNKREFEGLLA